MLHVWFVPSPDGPFAGTNPNLPFWAAGLAAPDSARMHDAEFSSRVRRASLALAEVIDTTSIFPNLDNRPAVKAASQWDAIYAAYLSSAITPAGRERMKRFVDMLLGHHAH